MTTPRLVLDARTVRADATGIGHYVAGLLRGLDAVAEPGRVVALRLAGAKARHSEWSESIWQGLRRVSVEEVGADYEAHPGGDWWLQTRLSGLLKRVGGGVLVSPAFIGPWGPRSFGRVLVVPDTIAWTLRGNYPKRFAWYLRAMMPPSAAWADRVVSISPSAANQVRRVLGGRRDIGVVPCAVDLDLFHPMEGERPTHLPDGRRRRGPVILYVASLEPRKNHRVLFEAMRQMPLADEAPEIVLLGDGSKAAKEDVLRQAEGLPVTLRKPADGSEVAAWTRIADAAAFPSRMEGFGLPGLEAMACGTPLVSARIDALRWLTEEGECARLCDPDSVDEWSEGLAEALRGGAEVIRRREAALRRAQGLTWPRSAERLLEEAERAWSLRRGGQER